MPATSRHDVTHATGRVEPRRIVSNEFIDD
jgi:hypothetical protein